jgi:hypothetical protein
MPDCSWAIKADDHFHQPLPQKGEGRNGLLRRREDEAHFPRMGLHTQRLDFTILDAISFHDHRIQIRSDSHACPGRDSGHLEIQSPARFARAP